MVQSKATTVADYLDTLSAEDRAAIEPVRRMILDHLPKGYVETMNWGMITYEIPLETYPDTYNKKPLFFAGLAAQKKHKALYLMCAYTDPAREQRIQEAFQSSGKKLDMGKSCIRYKKAEDLDLGILSELIAETDVETFIAEHKASREKK
jgi:hypothetical protein